ncbi:MAG: PilZ domain-containing protein [Candidatus Xenobia bacterium]
MIRESILHKTTPPPRLVERRLTFRSRCTVPVLIEGNNVEATAVNLSANGMKLHLSTPLKVDAEHLMGLRGKGLPGGMPSRLVTARTRVVWCRKARQGGGYDAGVVFNGFMGTDLDAVLEYMKVELGVALPDRGRQKRANVRVARRFKVTFSVNGLPASGSIRNIGMGGLALLCRNEVPVEASIDVTLDLTSGGDRITLSGLARYCWRPEGTELYQVGIAFGELQPDVRALLATWITAELKSEFIEG